ncbi:hypothetical protein KY344_01960 [Candidatus Woesearchaeota archaeon]|nr:hypothetical protein [Candidatus Woesearchaeota archaeon]
MRMINALGLDSMEKIWKYRLHLLRTFDIRLPEDMSEQVWLQSETSHGYALARLVKEFSRALPEKNRVRGVVVEKFDCTYKAQGLYSV